MSSQERWRRDPSQRFSARSNIESQMGVVGDQKGTADYLPRQTHVQEGVRQPAPAARKTNSGQCQGGTGGGLHGREVERKALAWPVAAGQQRKS